MAIVAAPALGAASSHRCVPGRGAWEGAMGAGTRMGTVLPALCGRAIGGYSVASALGTHQDGSGSWVAAGASPRPASVWGPAPNGAASCSLGEGSRSGGDGDPRPLFTPCCVLGRGMSRSVPRFPLVQSRTEDPAPAGGCRVPCRRDAPGSGLRLCRSGLALPCTLRALAGGTVWGQCRFPTGARARGAWGCRPRRQVTFLSRLLAAPGAPALYCTRRCGCRRERQGQMSPDPLGA